jgi:heme exporter protein CcmD
VKDYTFYVSAAYALTAVVLLVLLWRSLAERHAARRKVSADEGHG